MAGRFLLAYAAILLVAGCVHRPVPVYDARPLTPPHVYRQWWSEVEACVGRRADFDEVQWFVVPGLFVIFNEQLYDGFWFETHRVVIPEKRLLDGQTVKHEMAHVIQQRGHGRDFVEGCAPPASAEPLARIGVEQVEPVRSREPDRHLVVGSDLRVGWHYAQHGSRFSDVGHVQVQP
jgi:hypothetical protein